jgi:hypothetical protein
MANGKIYFVPGDRIEEFHELVTGEPEFVTDVTDAVGALYDLTLASMDFRSGFWSYEDAKPVAHMAELMGYEQREEIQKYRDDQLDQLERNAFYRDIKINPYAMPHHQELRVKTTADGSVINQWFTVPVAHVHVYATSGKCMWPKCENREGSSQ